MRWFLLPFILAFSCVGCEQIALLTTPAKKPQESCTPLAVMAKSSFWSHLHNGDYDKLPETTKYLTAAYLENPNDPNLAAYLGFAHIWKITERQRLQTIPPTIVDEIILSKNYFSDAVKLNSHDPRTQGFLADAILISGKIFHDERAQVRGYFKLKRAITMWPEFNYFTGGYPMSILDPASDNYQEALAWQWKTMDLCAETKIDRNNPNFSPYMHLETQQGVKRACWNSWIAPHNFEGFFMNMGDMLVKQGDWQTAIKIYNNAKLSRTYASWPYRAMLEERISQAKNNVSYFNDLKIHTRDKTIMFNSGYGCVVCHQSRAGR